MTVWCYLCYYLHLFLCHYFHWFPKALQILMLLNSVELYFFTVHLNSAWCLLVDLLSTRILNHFCKCYTDRLDQSWIISLSFLSKIAILKGQFHNVRSYKKAKRKITLKLIHNLVHVAKYCILFPCMAKILDKLSLKQLVCEEEYYFGCVFWFVLSQDLVLIN